MEHHFLPVQSAGGELVARLKVTPRPWKRGLEPLHVENPGEAAEEKGDFAAVQLLEGHEYRFEFFEPDVDRILSGSDALDLAEHRDTFDVDDPGNGRTGRLRPRLNVGTIRAHIRRQGSAWGTLRFEVRSKKLDYRDQYRWMLADLTGTFTEILLLRFAAAQHDFVPDPATAGQATYQQFAFLQTVLTGEELLSSLEEIASRPYLKWIDETEPRPPGRGFRASSAVARALVAPGPRQGWPNSPVPGLRSLPQRLEVPRSVATTDNIPNRFVKYVLVNWRELVADFLARMTSIADRQRAASRPVSTPIMRGLRECDSTLDHLDRLLARPFFREVGRLSAVPLSNQVLQKRSGYRTVLRAFLQSQLAASLTWDGGEDVYGAGKRDVATLYEYWAYLALAKILGQICERPPDLGTLVEAREGRLSVTLKTGKAVAVDTSVVRNGRHLLLELYFNRSFTTGKAGGSWTRPLRPDMSLRIRAANDYQPPLEEAWLHFDAKYKVEVIEDLFGRQGNTDEEEDSILDRLGERERETGRATRTDLLKMHAYKDALRRSHGAYILYPGDHPDRMTEYPRPPYREVLPGLGAFPLVPLQDGDAAGAQAVRGFLEEVLAHYASRASRHEEARYGERAVYDLAQPSDGTAALLTMPPGLTTLLVVRARSYAHYEWVRAGRTLDLPVSQLSTDPAPALAANRILLWWGADLQEMWGRTAMRVARLSQLVALGCPEASEDSFLVELRPIGGVLPEWKTERAQLQPDGPLLTDWASFFQS